MDSHTPTRAREVNGIAGATKRPAAASFLTFNVRLYHAPAL